MHYLTTFISFSSNYSTIREIVAQILMQNFNQKEKNKKITNNTIVSGHLIKNSI